MSSFEAMFSRLGDSRLKTGTTTKKSDLVIGRPIRSVLLDEVWNHLCDQTGTQAYLSALPCLGSSCE